MEAGIRLSHGDTPNLVASIYLARRLDDSIKELLTKYANKRSISSNLLNRFLYDFFHLFQEKTKELHQMYDKINKIHVTLKFTMVHITLESEDIEDRCDCLPRTLIPYLDTSLTIEKGRIKIDLFKKDTERNQYIMPSSCHP